MARESQTFKDPEDWFLCATGADHRWNYSAQVYFCVVCKAKVTKADLKKNTD